MERIKSALKSFDKEFMEYCPIPNWIMYLLFGLNVVGGVLVTYVTFTT